MLSCHLSIISKFPSTDWFKFNQSYLIWCIVQYFRFVYIFISLTVFFNSSQVINYVKTNHSLRLFIKIILNFHLAFLVIFFSFFLLFSVVTNISAFIYLAYDNYQITTKFHPYIYILWFQNIIDNLLLMVSRIRFMISCNKFNLVSSMYRVSLNLFQFPLSFQLVSNFNLHLVTRFRNSF